MSAAITGVAYLGLTGESSYRERTYAVVYRIVTTDATDGVLAVALASGMPTPGVSTYRYQAESDPWAVCQSLSPKQLTPTDWEVTARFVATPAGLRPRREDPSQFITDPLLRPIQWGWRCFGQDEVLFKDLNGRRFMNPAKSPYPPEVATFRRSRGILNLTKNYPWCAITLWWGVHDTVCNRAFWGFAPWTCLLDESNADPAYENGVAYVRATFNIKVGPAGCWTRTVNMQGPIYLDENGKRHWFADEKGTAGTEHGFLNPDGTKQSKEDLDANGPWADDFEAYPGNDWKVLQLD